MFEKLLGFLFKQTVQGQQNKPFRTREEHKSFPNRTIGKREIKTI